MVNFRGGSFFLCSVYFVTFVMCVTGDERQRHLNIQNLAFYGGVVTNDPHDHLLNPLEAMYCGKAMVSSLSPPYNITLYHVHSILMHVCISLLIFQVSMTV